MEAKAKTQPRQEGIRKFILRAPREEESSRESVATATRNVVTSKRIVLIQSLLELVVVEAVEAEKPVTIVVGRGILKTGAGRSILRRLLSGSRTR